MLGGLGDDQYYVDHANDAVKESANEGTDTVHSSVSYTLTANIENLILIGSNAINCTGNKLNNSIIGNVAINKLTGGSGNDFIDGGLGNDILKGGAGADTFSFSSQLSASNIDTVGDFSRGTDHIGLDARIFTQLLNDGNLADNLVVGVAGVTALDSNDYLLYNTTTKALYYDADGSGAGAAVQFATLVKVGTLSANDFAVI
jgi:Ca2+-binding RTX toxin-like protein